MFLKVKFGLLHLNMFVPLSEKLEIEKEIETATETEELKTSFNRDEFLPR